MKPTEIKPKMPDARAFSAYEDYEKAEVKIKLEVRKVLKKMENKKKSKLSKSKYLDFKHDFKKTDKRSK